MAIPRSHIVNLGALGAVVSALFAANYTVDPFNANQAVDLDFNKEAVTQRLSSWDWNVAEYRADPKPAVMLGDSRMDALDSARVEGHLGIPTYNFAYGGGTLADTISTFWYADGLTDLEHVVMGFNLTNLNQSKSYDAAGQAIALIDDPLRYYFSPFITGASARTLWFNVGKGKAFSEKPPMEPEQFWTFKMNNGHRLYASYTYPTGLLAQLTDIVAHCRKEKIELTFILFPRHMDLQELGEEYDLMDDWERTLDALAPMAPTWNYDVPNRVTRDAANFKDPFHTTEEVGNALVDEVFGGEHWLGVRPLER